MLAWILAYGILSLFISTEVWDPVTGKYDHTNSKLVSLVSAAIGILLAVVEMLILLRKPEVKPTGLCPSCSYNLTVNETGKCPECGHII